VEIFEGHRALFRPLARPAVALGNFDGVHIGHQELLARASKAASERDGDVVAYTFDPHPAQVLAAELAPPLLTSLERRLELLSTHGVTVAIVEPFTRELAATPPEAFHEILGTVLSAETVVVGYDFSYGANRAGSATTLKHWGAQSNTRVDVVEPVELGGTVASSTRVRELISSGELEAAATLLGRSHDVDGTVVRGEGRGRTIGVPTANVATKDALLPPRGVYAVRLRCLDEIGSPARPGAANLGVNPTFGDRATPSLEVHVLDFDGDLYDRPVRIELVSRLREERRFPGPEALVEQIHRDISAARATLSTES